MRFARLRWPRLERSDVLMSFIREKMRSASDVSSGISSMMATRRSTDMYSPEKVTSMCDQRDLNGRCLRPGLFEISSFRSIHVSSRPSSVVSGKKSL